VKSYTKKQRAILEFIAGYQREHGVSPTLEEIGDQFGVHRVTIFQHVAALERRGALRRGTQLARGIELLDPDFAPRPGIHVVGTIAAGKPLEAVETPEPLDVEELVPQDGEHFALRVRGDSMVDDGIRDGDLVVVRRTAGARNGQVVVAIVGEEEATLKRFYRTPDGRVRLEPANARLRPVVVDRCEVRGVVVSVVRRL
jgi:repressor LexA